VGLIVAAIADAFFRSSNSSSNDVCAAAFDVPDVACVVGFHRGRRQYCLLGGAQEGNHPESEGRRAYQCWHHSVQRWICVSVLLLILSHLPV